MGRLWSGMGGRRPRAGNTACNVFTNHETTAFMLFTRQESRNMVSPCPCGGSKERNPKPDQRVFHESRVTSHESRLLYFSSHDFPRFPGISRYYSAPLPPEPVSARRPPQLPSPSGLLGLRPVPNEPMLRKENVIDCTKRGAFYIAWTRRGAGLCRSVVGDRIQPESEAYS